MESELALDELLPFLATFQRSDLRQIAAQHLLGLCSTDCGRATIGRRLGDCIATLQASLSDDSDPLISKLIVQSLVNLCTDDDLSAKLVSDGEHGAKLLSKLLQLAVLDRPATDVESMSVDTQEAACMTLSNISRSPSCCRTVWQHLALDQCFLSDLEKVVSAVCRDAHSADHLAMFLCNLSQLKECRIQLMNRETNLIGRLLPVLNYMKSDVRRKGVVGVVRNCCFDTSAHCWLLSDAVGLLTALVYPLAGPEEFDEDEMSELPLELQYLGEDKRREPDPDIRRMLIESINQLCANKEGREFIRQQRIYLIMREFHKWETIDEVVTACENLVDILIGDEPEPGMENLKEIAIPDDVLHKFDNMSTGN